MFEFYTLDGELKYKSKRKTIGAVEHEKGIFWKLASINNLAREEFHPLVYTSFDYGLLTPVDHSSVWLRTSLGASFGDRDEPKWVYLLAPQKDKETQCMQ